MGSRGGGSERRPGNGEENGRETEAEPVKGNVEGRGSLPGQGRWDRDGRRRERQTPGGRPLGLGRWGPTGRAWPPKRATSHLVLQAPLPQSLPSPPHPRVSHCLQWPRTGDRAPDPERTKIFTRLQRGHSHMKRVVVQPPAFPASPSSPRSSAFPPLVSGFFGGGSKVTGNRL